jgi:hypothetical protein
MSNIILTGPAQDHKLHLNLQLVKDLEQAGGSLFKTADMLLQRELPLTDVLNLVTVAYRAAGCGEQEEELNAFLLQRAPALILTEILVGLLAPMRQMGVSLEGKPQPA